MLPSMWEDHIAVFAAMQLAKLTSGGFLVRCRPDSS